MKRRELERLERYIEQRPQGTVIARLEITGTGLVDGGTAAARLKVRLKA